jgi:hypothetical protein
MTGAAFPSDLPWFLARQMLRPDKSLARCAHQLIRTSFQWISGFDIRIGGWVNPFHQRPCYR